MSWVSFVKGKFLVDQTAARNWKFVVFLAVLAMVSITASHRVNRRIFQIAELSDEVRELKAAFIGIRADLRTSKLEIEVAARVKKVGLKPPSHPPELIYMDESEL